MGFDDTNSWKAVKRYKGNIVEAINYLTKHQNKQNDISHNNKNQYEAKKKHDINYASDTFDKCVANTNITYTIQEYEPTPANIAKQIIIIYKKLLEIVSSQNNTGM